MSFRMSYFKLKGHRNYIDYVILPEPFSNSLRVTSVALKQVLRGTWLLGSIKKKRRRRSSIDSAILLNGVV